jgi:PAS domain S-box-containing protein
MELGTGLGVGALAGVLLLVMILAFRFAVGQGRAQDRMRQSYADADAQRERLVAVLRSVPDGLLVLDEQDRVVMANERAAGLWGLAGGEIGGLSATVLSRRGGLSSGGEPWRLVSLLEGGRGESVGPVEMQAVGTERVLEVSATPVAATTGHGVIGTIVLLRDITERRQVEALRKNLTDMMVHDLRTPLGGVYSSLKALRNDEGMAADIREQILGVAERSAERMLAMTETLVDISRLEAGKMPLELTTVRLEPLLRRAAEQVEPQAASKQQDVRLAVEPADAVAWADARLLERVVLNLLANGIKFTPRAGEVEVRGSLEPDGTVRIAVRDTGPGILEGDRARIFDRFTQTGQRHQWGSGLGLAFCQLVIEAHGGRIWVESTVDQGSVFQFTLPGREGGLA